MGARLLLPAGATPDLAQGSFADWDRLRLMLGVPDGSRDLVVDKSILLENGFDELRGVAWDKGCYVGQELTARTKYRGLVKKRLLPVAVQGPLPPPGTLVMAGEREAGEVRSGADGLALALVRLDALEADLTAGEARLVPQVPEWVRLPEKAGA
ncbi:CAF17-like 4Fe-4S cluster assembly/insertion protein YgfZ [Aerophototrophica crusticola]|uniref:CAF17-like 4Fe-4S cluster assembly/insertion protein YgfZ n=1 Tax=Aerophototrophica crusticola TaxID=1709002 RepID=UPI00384EE4AE